MSLNRLAVALLRLEVSADAEVVSEGVWQTAQPMALNSDRPLLMDVEPPGVVVEGVGGARKRMKFAKATTSLRSRC